MTNYKSSYVLYVCCFPKKVLPSCGTFLLYKTKNISESSYTAIQYALFFFLYDFVHKLIKFMINIFFYHFCGYLFDLSECIHMHLGFFDESVFSRLL